MAFDAKAWIAANSPPTFTDPEDGKTYTGRLWSHVEYLRWLEVFEQWTQGTLDDYEGQLQKLLGSMGFAPAVVTKMIALPAGAFEGLVTDFFDRQKSGRSSRLTPGTPFPAEATLPPTAPASASPAS